MAYLSVIRIQSIKSTPTLSDVTEDLQGALKGFRPDFNVGRIGSLNCTQRSIRLAYALRGLTAGGGRRRIFCSNCRSISPRSSEEVSFLFSL